MSAEAGSSNSRGNTEDEGGHTNRGASGPAAGAGAVSSGASWQVALAAGLTRSTLAQIPARFPRLQYLMLSLPGCVTQGELSCMQALGPLRSLQGLKGLTLQAHGCEWGEGEVADVLGSPTSPAVVAAAGAPVATTARASHGSAGSRAGAAVMLGAGVGALHASLGPLTSLRSLHIVAKSPGPPARDGSGRGVAAAARTAPCTASTARPGPVGGLLLRSLPYVPVLPNSH